MANKSFSIFNDNNGQAVETGDKLVMEVGKSHIACILVKPETNAIAGFELFSFPETEAESTTKLFEDVSNQSLLMKEAYSTINVFLNNEICLPVPLAKFSESASNDYLNLIFGDDLSSIIHFDKLVFQPDIVSVYRISQELSNILNQHFPNFILNHSWSNVLNIIHSKRLSTSKEFVHIQFYNTYFIAVVMMNGMLHLIQTFVYENVEDVMYQLLNVFTQFGLSATEVEIHVCGLIDPNYKLFRELTNYFKNIITDKTDLGNVSININGHPPHYFTPFFNLAV